MLNAGPDIPAKSTLGCRLSKITRPGKGLVFTGSQSVIQLGGLDGVIVTGALTDVYGLRPEAKAEATETLRGESPLPTLADVDPVRPGTMAKAR